MTLDENCVVLLQNHRASLQDQSSLNHMHKQHIENNNPSSSGLLVNYKHGFVITTAVLFESQLQNINFNSSQFADDKHFLTLKDFARPQVTVVLQDKFQNDIKKQFLSVPGKLFLLWKCNDFEKAITEHFSDKDGWKFREFEDDDCLKDKSCMTIEPVGLKSDIEVKENLVFWFALIKLEPSESIGYKNLEHFPSVDLQQGERLLACGTPFGALCPPVFMNSLSTGIVSNLAGKDNTLIMTDARVMPGSEGAGLYVLLHGDVKQRVLVGMIVSSLCWKSNEWIGLTLAVSISSLLHSLQRLSRHVDLPVSLLPPIGDHDYRKVGLAPVVISSLNSVVYVQAGPIWGSGVIIDKVKGYIVTCRHVVKKNKTRGVRVFIRYPRPMWIAADVVFLTSATTPIDLAILKLKHCPHDLQAVKPATAVNKGQWVFAVGHSLFGFEVQKQPSVTSGIVSNTTVYKQQLVMIQSSCAVHGGASGGALLCADTGKLIGIISCNSRDLDNNASFPHVNFSIPAALFWQPVKEYVQSEELSVLDTLNNTDSVMQHIWQLNAPEINWVSKL